MRQVDDLNRNFTFPSNHFDLVQSRLLATGIHGARWPTYIRDIVRYEDIRAWSTRAMWPTTQQGTLL